MEYYKHYLVGQQFRKCLDHDVLNWLFSLKEPKHGVARWIEVPSEFDFEVEYQPGKKQMPYPDVQTLGTAPVLEQGKMNYHASHVRSA